MSNPLKWFINTAKAGTDVPADSEALARLISYILRLASPIELPSAVQEVWAPDSPNWAVTPAGVFGPQSACAPCR